MVARDHQHQVLVEQWPLDQVGLLWGRFTTAASSDPDGQVRFEGRRGAVADHQPDLGMGAAMPSSRSGASQRAVVPIIPIRAVPADLVAEGGHVGHGRLELGGDPPAPLHHRQALLGQLTAVAVDELDAELPLQPGDVAGHVRLHGVQGRRRGGEAAVVGDGDEGLQLAEIHLGKRYYSRKETT